MASVKDTSLSSALERGVPHLDKWVSFFSRLDITFLQ